MAKSVYKVPETGQPLITTISSGCKTPLLRVKFCNLLNPYYYPNSPTIARYSITCLVDPDEHRDFLEGIQTIEKNENVDSIIKNETAKEDRERVNTGMLLVKFQGKNQIPVYVVRGKEEPIAVALEDEFAADEKVMVIYEILRYTKKNSMKAEHGISFKPLSLYYFPEA